MSHDYLIVHPQIFSCASSVQQEHCNAMGGHLASATNPREYSFLQQITQTAGQSIGWLGGFHLQVWTYEQAQDLVQAKRFTLHTRQIWEQHSHSCSLSLRAAGCGLTVKVSITPTFTPPPPPAATHASTCALPVSQPACYIYVLYIKLKTWVSINCYFCLF